MERWDDAAVTDIIRRTSRDVGMPAAGADYVDRVLTDAPVNLVGLPPRAVAQGTRGR